MHACFVAAPSFSILNPTTRKLVIRTSTCSNPQYISPPPYPPTQLPCPPPPPQPPSCTPPQLSSISPSPSLSPSTYPLLPHLTLPHPPPCAPSSPPPRLQNLILAQSLRARKRGGGFWGGLMVGLELVWVGSMGHKMAGMRAW